MQQVSVLQAKTELSKLIHTLELRQEDVIVIAKYGKPVAKLVPYEETPVSKQIGIAKGKFTVPEDFDADNEEIAAMFMGGSL